MLSAPEAVVLSSETRSEFPAGRHQPRQVIVLAEAPELGIEEQVLIPQCPLKVALLGPGPPCRRVGFPGAEALFPMRARLRRQLVLFGGLTHRRDDGQILSVRLIPKLIEQTNPMGRLATKTKHHRQGLRNASRRGLPLGPSAHRSPTRQAGPGLERCIPFPEQRGQLQGFPIAPMERRNAAGGLQVGVHRVPGTPRPLESMGNGRMGGRHVGFDIDMALSSAKVGVEAKIRVKVVGLPEGHAATAPPIEGSVHQAMFVEVFEIVDDRPGVGDRSG